MSAQFPVDTDRIAAAAGDVARISADIEGQVGVMLARLTGLQHYRRMAEAVGGVDGGPTGWPSLLT